MKLTLFNLKINQITTANLVKEILKKALKGDSAYLCAVNSHMVVEAQKDSILKEAILNSDWAVTDGVPVSWAFSYFNGVKQERVAGMSITPLLIELAETNNLSISIYGNTDKNLELFKEYIVVNHPNLKLGKLISPPFRKLSDEELIEDIEQINNSNTNILFVSLGCPKQEKWMFENSHKMNCVSLGIGNAINTTIGEEKRPSKVIQKFGLEWLFRLVQNPKRLFKRYLITNSKFCWIVLKNLSLIKKKK